MRGAVYLRAMHVHASTDTFAEAITCGFGGKGLGFFVYQNLLYGVWFRV